tara:strand:+ start:3965 stop:4195 length:231 start_codon:yes stop_codon:yes gene_type:complete
MNLYIIIYFLLFFILLHLLLYFFNIDIFELFEKNEKKVEEIKKNDDIEEKQDTNIKNDIINDLEYGIQQLKDINSI